MTEDNFKRIEAMMARRIGVMEENVQHKFDLLVEVLIEGQHMLAERMDRMEMVLRGEIKSLPPVEGRLTRVETKVDGVAADFAHRRADTEAVYQVREE